MRGFPCYLKETVPAARQLWTLSESKATEYTLHTFDSADSNQAYLLPFQLLRMAFHRNFTGWSQQYKRATQDSGRWQSECLFVPAYIVLDAIGKEMQWECPRG